MKKIMFNDRYGLQQSVLDGSKTMTRRIATELNYPLIGDISEWGQDDKGRAMISVRYSTGLFNDVYPHYQPGEIVALAQSYEQIYLGFSEPRMRHDFGMRVSAVHHTGDLHSIAGWTNKMFVKAEYMPHRIRITNIKAERLQDISEEDAMREGVFKYDKPPLHHERDMYAPWPPYLKPYKWDHDNLIYRCNARGAAAYLIDKISGRGTWNINPWVWVYSFELLKED